MSDLNSGKIIKKRGRKPKNKLLETQPIINEIIDTENDVIITHLPITINDLKLKENQTDIFIKLEGKSPSNNEKIIDNQISSIESDNKSSNGIYVNKINIHKIEIKHDTKCWWCKNSFDTPNVILPEHYFDGTFYCIGNFCSYNCAKAYNIDINDSNIWKRESLINLMYYLTYNSSKQIHPAPSWLTLKEFGGFMLINDFRKNFETNNSEYILLYPPLISRQMQIEESYKKINSSGPVNKIDKILNQDYLLKRNKPIETLQFFIKKPNDNLQKIMGLKN
jgi:hypothetical protein